MEGVFANLFVEKILVGLLHIPILSFVPMYMHVCDSPARLIIILSQVGSSLRFWGC